MSFSQRSWIAAALLPDDVAEQVVDVRSEMVLYGSNAGPFPGISGAAMTYFQVTAITLPGHLLVFADDRLLGWEADPKALDAFKTVTRLAVIKDVLAEALQPASTCPIPLRERTTP